MRVDRWVPLVLALICLSSCKGDGATSDPPDYNIRGELPSEIKILAGGPASSHFRRVIVGRAGTSPAPALVTLGVGALPAGITAVYQGAAAGRPEFNTRLQINVPAGIAVGSYPIPLTGTAPPVAAKTTTPYTVRAYGPDDGGAYIEITPSEVTLIPGGPGVVVLATIKRIPPFVGNVTVTYPGAGSTLPPGVRVAGLTTYTFPIGGAAGDVVTRQFIIIANGEAPSGHATPAAEARTGAGAGAKTDAAAHVVSVP